MTRLRQRRIAQARAEERRAMAVAKTEMKAMVQEMRAR